MAASVIQTVYVRAGDNAPREAKLHVTEYSSGDRIKRASLLLVGFWAAAIVSVGIPIAHWILVPGFTVMGPIAAYRRYREASASTKIELACPACSEKQSVNVDASDKVPFYVYCPKCNAGMQVTAQ